MWAYSVTEQPATIARWFEFVESKDVTALDAMIADDAVFRSPAVFTPQEGKALTMAYLTAALDVLGPSIEYRSTWAGTSSAVLEFESHLDGTVVHGIDMIRWDDAGRITEFTVMVRPLRGLEKLISLMGQKLTQRD